MAIEEKVIQTDTNATETVASQPPAQPPSPSLESVKAEYETKLAAAKKEAAEKEAKWTEKLNDVKSITNDVNKILKKNLIPTVTTHYERLYLISFNKKIRATIDYDLKGSNFFHFNYNPVYKKARNLVLELKYGKMFDDYVRKNCGSISSRYSKNSKYVYFVMNCFN